MITPTFTLAMRQLTSSVVSTMFIVVSLSIAIGAVAGSYGLLDAVVWRRLGVREPEQLVTIAPMTGEAVLGMSGATVAALGKAQTSFEGLCGFSRGAMPVEIASTISRRGMEAVSGDCYDVLGVGPHLGRLIGPADAPLSGNSAAVVVISHALWTNALGADAEIIGRTLRVEGVDLSIIGVLPASFMGLHVDQGPDIVLPLGLVSSLLGNKPPRVTALYAVGRLKQHVSLQQARAELRNLWPAIWSAANPSTVANARVSPAADPASLRIESGAGGISDLRRQYATALYAVLALAASLLLMAGVNIAGLLIAHNMKRIASFKMLTALGANSVAIVGQLITEAFMLGVMCAAGAVAVAWTVGSVAAARVWVGFLPMTMAVTPQPALLSATAAFAVVVMLILTIPAAALVLNHTSSQSAGIRSPVNWTWWRRSIVAAQAAVALAIVFCASLITKNLIGLREIDPGYAVSRLSFNRLERLPGQTADWDRSAYVAQLLDRIQGLPGIEGAALSSSFPTTDLRQLTSLLKISSAAGAFVNGREFRASPRFFDTIQVALRSGRDFAFDDTAGRPPVGIITETLARELFGNTDALGQTIAVGSPDRQVTVIGVVSDFSPGDVRITNLPAVYSPLLQAPQQLTSPMLVIRSGSAQNDAIRRAVREQNRHYVSFSRSVAEHLSTLIARERILFAFALLFGVVSIAIGGTGLFAALSYAVASRNKELAVRLAVGAQRRQILWTVTREAAIAVGVGIALGAPLAVAAARGGEELLFSLSAVDWPLLMTCAGAMAFIAGAAAVWPALSATRVDPVVTLRDL
ncbi:MAG: ABC transporter permease [Cyanobacteria bacterium]|nr:ABC transporter permease [Cyanobacteriota bacterium]